MDSFKYIYVFAYKMKKITIYENKILKKNFF